MLGYDKDATALEINLTKESDVVSFEKSLEKMAGDNLIIKNRYEQRETVYKMMKTEKLAIYVILIFILTIISFNIYGSLSMLIIEKREDSETLKAMGAREKTVRDIFLLEGWLISLAGVIAGAVLGVSITLLQKYFGIVPMPGNFIVDAYPVVLKLSDIVLSVSGVTIIGYIAARLPLRILKNI